MPFDVIGWAEAAPGTGTVGITGAGQDRSYEVNGDNIRIMERAKNLLGLYFGAESTPGYAQLSQPSLKTDHQFIQSILNGDVDVRGGITSLMARPLPLKEKEWCLAQSNNATDEDTMIVAFVGDQKITQADLDAVLPTHKIRGTVDQGLTANAWTFGAVTWDQDLPEGLYYAVGLKVFSYKAAAPGHVAVRLLCPDTTWRPGCMAAIGEGDKIDNMSALVELPFNNWPLMKEITFNESNMPNVELLSPYANTDHVVELLAVGPAHF